MSLTPVFSMFEDARDDLERARLGDLVAYAHECGMHWVDRSTARAIPLRKELRKRGYTRPKIRRHPLGFPEPREGDPSEIVPDAALNGGVEVNAEDDFIRQLEAQQPTNDPAEEREAEAPPVQPKKEANPGFKKLARLRSECKAKGIKITRRDNIQTMEAKLGIGAIVNDQNTD